MNFKDIMIVCILLLLIHLSHSTFIEINQENFRKIENSPKVVLYFYERNCSKCNSFFEIMNNLITNELPDTDIIFAKINATMHPSLLFLYQVSDLPTVIGLRSLNLFHYGRTYNDEGFSNFINEIFINPVPKIINKDELNVLITTEESLVVGYFNNENSILANSYKTACLLVNYTKCVFTSNDKVKSILKTNEDNHISLVKHNGQSTEFLNFSGNYTSPKEISEFIQINDLPLMFMYTNQTKSKIFQNPIKLHLLIFIDKSLLNFDNFLEGISLALKKTRGKAISILFDIKTSPEIDETLNIFDLNQSDTPTFAFIKVDDFEELKYPSFTKSVTSENILKLFEEIQNGTRKPNFKSESLSPNWNSSNVIILVRENYKNITENKNLTVLVNFYSPSCHHSGNLDKIWEELGEFYKNKSDVVISKINSNLNEIDGFPIYSTPAIFIYTKTNKTPIRFENERNLNNFVEFIENNGKYSEITNEQDKTTIVNVKNKRDEL